MLSSLVGRLRLANPVMPGSGTFDYDPAVDSPVHPDVLGAMVPKSITLHPQVGNPPPRLVETASGLINSIGIPSLGLEDFMTRLLPSYASSSTPLVVSVAGYSAEEFAIMAAAMEQAPEVSGIELNLSCPNLEESVVPATDLDLLAECVEAARGCTEKPIWAKLAPNVVSIVPYALRAVQAGADAVVVANTWRAVEIDVRRGALALGHGSGGLSGPAIRPLVMAMVLDLARHTDVPVIASGGILTLEDTLGYLMAGACAVQVGTANFRDPLAMPNMVHGLEAYMRTHGYANMRDLVGLVLRGQEA